MHVKFWGVIIICEVVRWRWGRSWRRLRANHRWRCCRCPNHLPPRPILRLIVVSSSPSLSPLQLRLLLSSPPRPREEPTDQSSRGRETKNTTWRQSRWRCCRIIAGCGKKGRAQEEGLSSSSSLATPLTIFFRKQPKIDQNWKLEIVMSHWRWFNVAWLSPNWEISQNIVGILPGSLTGLAIVVSIILKSWLLSVACLFSFLLNSEHKKNGIPARIKRYWREQRGRTPNSDFKSKSANKHISNASFPKKDLMAWATSGLGPGKKNSHPVSSFNVGIVRVGLAGLVTTMEMLTLDTMPRCSS